MRPDDAVAAGLRAKLAAVKDWDDAFTKASAYANKMLAYRRPERALEIAQEALARIWDPACTQVAGDTEDEIMLAIFGLVRGLASNDRRRKHHQNEVYVKDHVRDAVGDGAASPEEQLAEQQERALAISKLRARVANDQMGIKLVELFASGVEEPQAQSAAAGAPIEEIRNARKRVFRHADAMARERAREEEVA